jgi:ATP-binding cassette subfamily F protein uup
VNLLSVERLSKSYGEKDLFTDISFGINKGEKAALIARNGTGKSSLLNILAGRDIADSGKVTLRNDIRWAYLEQDPLFDESKTILQHLFESGSGNLHLISRYEALLEEQVLHPDDKKIQHDLQHLSSLIETHRAWDAEAQVRQILGRLDIHDLQRKIGELSGGQRKRITLAKALIGEPDLLLMDEPTNHLDVDMIEWLEDYLIKSPCGLLLVTHDRYFLDDVCDKILELDGGKLYSYEGNYSYFLEKKAEREMAEASELSKTKNIFRKELEWIRRMPRARGTKSKARVSSFEVLKTEVKGKRQEEEMQLDVKMNRIGGKCWR